jgi:thioredoxin 1
MAIIGRGPITPGEFMGSENVTDVTDANFSEEVLQSDRPVLVDFWATWCAPCRAIAPHVENLAGEHSETLKVVKLDVQNNMETALAYRVNNIPTLIVFKNGAEVGRQQGTGGGLPGIKSFVEKHIES